MSNSLKHAAERRRVGLDRSASLAVGIVVAAGAGALAIAVGLATNGAATTATGGNSGTAATQSGDDTATTPQPAQVNGGVAAGGNSAPQAQSHGS